MGVFLAAEPVATPGTAPTGPPLTGSPPPPDGAAASSDEIGAPARASAKAKARVLFTITLRPCAAHWRDNKASTPGEMSWWLSPSMLHADSSTPGHDLDEAQLAPHQRFRIPGNHLRVTDGFRNRSFLS
jgi:hypothetical protein